MPRISIDFETRSLANLTLTGSWEYAAHNSTEVLCMAWALNDEPVNMWSYGQPFPEDLGRYIKLGATLAAWNCQFERHVWNLCQVKKLGWPEVDFDQWVCTAAKSAHANHPRSLDNAATMLLPGKAGKDTDGHKLMMTMCKPQKWTKKELKAGATGLKWIEDPISMALLEGYCKQDVVAERALDRILPAWPEDEIKIWRMNERINDRGVPFDRGLCVAAKEIMAQNLEETSAKISKLTDGVITTGNQIKRIKEFINERGVNTDSLDADSVEALLETELDEDVRDVLLMRQITAGAAAKKYISAVDVMSDDDRGRGLFMYYGGMTGRFASLKTQIQNMKHGSDTTGVFRDAVVSQDLDLMHTLYGDTIITELGKNVRSMVCAPEGHTLVRCDSSQIECRVLHWLAGNETMLQTFRDKADPYLKFASSVYNYKVTKAEYSKRQLGKCLAGETQVLTDTGWTRLDEVKLSDKLWDGTEWCLHEGVIHTGEKETICLANLHLTPDHLVWTGKHWNYAKALAQNENTLCQALGKGSDAFESLGASWAHVVELPTYTTESQSLKPVYDIVNVGKHNRFLVNTNRGPLLVHNCSVLGLGFGMGAKRFIGSAADYNVEVTEKFSQFVVNLWREENPLVLKFWKNLEASARACVTRRQNVRVGHLRFGMWKDYLVLRLPSGRCLYYYQPKFVGEGRDIRFQYLSVRGVRNEWAGGLLCENAVQGTARDTLVYYMKLAMDLGLDIVAHIHDEIILQCPLADANRVEKQILECFASKLDWMDGLPCAAEATVYPRYAG